MMPILFGTDVAKRNSSAAAYLRDRLPGN